jgi:demethylmenaquinone methyltransferase/2-methoxy-6-polyprenyl-1,4-benzoquinol methylase
VRLRDTLSTPAGKATYVRDVFATIADRYDLITVLLSYGQDRRWKQRLLALAGEVRGCRVLDLACGTGDITLALAAHGATAIGLDLTPRMIELAVARREGQPSRDERSLFLLGDMGALPFPPATFDIVTTGYGLRNVPNIDRAVAQIARVLRPGGLLLSLDFNRPTTSFVRAAYHTYLSCVGSALGWVLHGDPNTYRYIPESIRLYPGADRVVDILQAHGFPRATWHPVLGGLLAIHEARKDARAGSA